MASTRIPRTILGRYTLVGELGAGGMGRVLLVEDQAADGQLLALKWIPRGDPGVEARHRQEFEVLSQFDHPHLLGAYRFGTVEPGVGQFFTCEHIEGPSLADVQDGLEVADALAVLVQICRGLSYLHEQGWVHGDIKPENILLRPRKAKGGADACLIDFGLAHPEGHPPEEKLLGTVYFMPPERLLRIRSDARSDLYSLGVVAYRVLTGQLPFPGPGQQEVIDGHLRGHVPRPRELRPSLPAELDPLLLSLLAKRPADRPESVRDVLRVLTDLVDEPSAPETRETLRAHVRNRQVTGWENPLAELMGRVLPCPGAPSESVVVRHPSLYDLDRFRAAVVRALELAGVHPVEITAGPGAFSELLQAIEGLAPVGSTKSSALGELRRAVEDDTPSAELIARIGRELLRTATRIPLAVLVERGEESGELNALIEGIGGLTAAADGLPVAPEGSPALSWIVFQRVPQGRRDGLLPGETENAAAVLDLSALDPETMKRWLSTRFPTWQVPKDLLTLLEEESEGNPALLERILGSMIDEGLLRKDWSGWKVASFDEQYPQTPLVRWAMRSYEVLEDELRRILDALVVLGGSGDPEWIRRTRGDGGDGFWSYLRELLRRGWLDREPDGNRYRFRYFFQLKAVRQSIPQEPWHRGNLQVADWLSSRAESGDDIDPERLALHLVNAGEIERAAPFVRRAIRRALTEGRILAAIRWIERLLHRHENLSGKERVDLLNELGDLRQIWGSGEALLSVRHQALDRELQENGPGTRATRLSLKLAECEAWTGDVRTALRFVQEVLPVVNSAESPELGRWALLALGDVGLLQGTPEVLDPLWSALDALPQVRNPQLIGREAELRVRYHTSRHEPESARDAIERATVRLLEVGTHRATAWVRWLEGRRAQLEGRWHMAVEDFHEAARRFGVCRQSPQRALALMAAGELLLGLERFPEAMAFLERGESLARRIGARALLPAALGARGEWAVRRGDPSSEASLVALERWGQRFPGREWLWQAGMLRADDALRRGDFARALEVLSGQAHPLAAGGSAEAWSRWGCLGQRLGLRAGDLREVQRRFEEALRELRSLGSTFHEIPLWIEQWRVLDELGCADPAGALAAQIDRWVIEMPEHEFRWRLARGWLNDEQLLEHGDAALLARATMARGLDAVRAEEWNRALFLLEEAEQIARQAEVQPLGALAAAHLRRWQVPTTPPGEDPVWRNLWRKVSRAGAEAIQVLTLWSEACEAYQKGSGARLGASARRRVELWTRQLPYPHDPPSLRARLGLAPDPAGWPLQGADFGRESSSQRANSR